MLSAVNSRASHTVGASPRAMRSSSVPALRGVYTAAGLFPLGAWIVTTCISSSRACSASRHLRGREVAGQVCCGGMWGRKIRRSYWQQDGPAPRSTPTEWKYCRTYGSDHPLYLPPNSPCITGAVSEWVISVGPGPSAARPRYAAGSAHVRQGAQQSAAAWRGYHR